MSKHRTPPEPVKDWYRIAVAATDTTEQSSADVYIYDAIGGWWGVNASEFVRDLAALDVDRINLFVNSPGGSVFDGVAIMNAIRRHRAHVVATVDGLAASAASFVIQAADEIVMARGSELMVHDAWSIAIGNAADMAETSAQLDRISNSMAGLYAERAGGTREDWRAAMQAETWYDAAEAVEAGLADRTEATARPAAAALAGQHDRSMYAHAGRASAPAPWMPGAAAAAAHAGTTKPPAEPAGTTNPNMEGADIMSDTLIKGLRERLGISETAKLDETALLGKLDEKLAAQNTQPEPPAGTVLIEESVLAGLQTDAQAGRQARDKQLADARAAVVAQAVADGRIAPARREHWIAQLEADPGAESVLLSLAKGTIPLAPAGYTGGVDEASDEDRIYTKAWGNPSKTEKEA